MVLGVTGALCTAVAVAPVPAGDGIAAGSRKCPICLAEGKGMEGGLRALFGVAVSSGWECC